MTVKLTSLFLLLILMFQGVLQDISEEMNLGGTLFLVNRDFTIPADYEPQDLVKPQVTGSSDSTRIRAEAAHALEEMFNTAKEEMNYKLVAISGYRSFRTQSTIYANKIKKAGKKQASLLVAPPGASEHQLGLAMDLGCKGSTGLTGSFGKTPEGKWVAENCWRFGFIIRYKEEWTDITGYAYEPWHVRYVGKEHAALIRELNVPLEIYITMLRDRKFLSLIQGTES